MTETPEPTAASGPRHGSRLWLPAAGVLFTLAFISVYGGLVAHGIDHAVPVRVAPGSEPKSAVHPLGVLAAIDQRFTVWVVARNARVLLRRPLDLFAAEQCYPARNSLAFGEPAITLGILGVPAYLLTRDPVATFNLVLMSLALISAFAIESGPAEAPPGD